MPPRGARIAGEASRRRSGKLPGRLIRPTSASSRVNRYHLAHAALPEPLSVIDDDDLVRAAIQAMLKSVGLHADTFESTFGGRERCNGSQKDQERGARNRPSPPCADFGRSPPLCTTNQFAVGGGRISPKVESAAQIRGCQLFPGNRGFRMFKQGIARPGSILNLESKFALRQRSAGQKSRAQ
jgi:hypothetical protein